MTRETLSEVELKVKRLEDRIKELEKANQMLQEYFSETSGIMAKKERSSPFSGSPEFSNVFDFTIDLKLQMLVWLKAKNFTLGIREERLFLKDIKTISFKLLISIDRKRFINIISQYINGSNQTIQTILRVKLSDQKFVWVLACFEKVILKNKLGNYLQVKFIKLNENKEEMDLFNEFLKKTEKGDQYQKIELLTPRQREILSFLGKGLSSKEIADHLNISFHTVESHRKAIAKKTQIRKRAALISLAAEIGIIQ